MFEVVILWCTLHRTCFYDLVHVHAKPGRDDQQLPVRGGMSLQSESAALYISMLVLPNLRTRKARACFRLSHFKILFILIAIYKVDVIVFMLILCQQAMFL
jgi:hypothetical protein